jgi:hypothetical protein
MGRPGTVLAHEDADELPDLENVIAEARLKRSGQPLDPRVAAWPSVLVLARGMIYRATKRDRRTGVLAQFERQVHEIEDAVSGCRTFGEQLLALQTALDAAQKRDRREERPSKGPSDEDLLQEYEEIRPRIARVWDVSRNFEDRRRRLLVEFPGLSDEAAKRADDAKPSQAAYEVLGDKYGLSRSRIQVRCTSARKPKKRGATGRGR